MVAADKLRQALKARGLRMTPQRQLILDVVGAMQGHISADQVHQQVTTRFPDVHITTVYRTLEVLEELSIVRHTHFHDGVALFERTDEAPHHHMVCTACHADIEVDLDVLQPLAEELHRRYRFRPDLAHSAIIGICGECQKASDANDAVQSTIDE